MPYRDDHPTIRELLDRLLAIQDSPRKPLVLGEIIPFPADRKRRRKTKKRSSGIDVAESLRRIARAQAISVRISLLPEDEPNGPRAA